MTVLEVVALLATVGGVGGIASSLIKIGELKRELTDLGRRHAELATEYRQYRTEYREEQGRLGALVQEHHTALAVLVKDVSHIRENVDDIKRILERQ